jgi:2-hydroxy-3-oxopropionate reductase
LKILLQFSRNATEHKMSTHIAFLGIGLMGEPMVQRLLQAGFMVSVWNRTHGKTASVASLGAQAHAALPDAVAGASIIL